MSKTLRQIQEPKSGGAHIPGLDGIRGLAVFIVFLFHYGGGAQSHNFAIRAFGQIIQLGWSGVTLFFVLSGFLITGILWKSRGNAHWWSTFYVRRVLRIFPLYYLALAMVLAGGFIQHKARALGFPLSVYALYLQNWPIATNIQKLTPLWLVHFWSLAVEEQFYLVWPFILFLMPSIRRARQSCVLLFLLSLAARIWGWHTGAQIWETTIARAGELAVGAWVALSIQESPEWAGKVRRWTVPVLLASLAVPALCAVLSHDKGGFSTMMYLAGIPAFSFAGASLILLVLQGGSWARCFRFAPLRHLGTISYGVYVYHLLFFAFWTELATLLAPHASRNMQLSIRMGIAACFTLIIAELSFRFYERPLLRLKDRFAPSASRASAAPVDPLVATQEAMEHAAPST